MQQSVLHYERNLHSFAYIYSFLRVTVPKKKTDSMTLTYINLSKLCLGFLTPGYFAVIVPSSIFTRGLKKIHITEIARQQLLFAWGRGINNNEIIKP